MYDYQRDVFLFKNIVFANVGHWKKEQKKLKAPEMDLWRQAARKFKRNQIPNNKIKQRYGWYGTEVPQDDFKLKSLRKKARRSIRKISERRDIEDGKIERNKDKPIENI